jgi:hypothetical protein
LKFQPLSPAFQADDAARGSIQLADLRCAITAMRCEMHPGIQLSGKIRGEG